jgi:glycosyltransferase involved in cell wall biosynthesis
MQNLEEKLPTSLLPKVSVAITSFNSASWLARALDSVLAQRTDFPIEIVIGDDCSQDDTINVAHSYQQKFPGKIVLIERAANVGIQRNYYETFDRCRGKYIAWLDADDYWTDPEKLAIQIAIMELNPSITLCGHYIRVVSPDGEIKQERSPSLSAGQYGLADVLHTCFLPSLSAVFRNGLHRQLPAWYFDLAPVTEWPIWVLAARSGKVVMLDRVMADYMHTPGSAAASKGYRFRAEMEAKFFERIESIVPTESHRLVHAEKGRRYESLAYFLRKERDFVAARKAAIKAFQSPALRDNLASKTKSIVASVICEMQWRFGGSKARDVDACDLPAVSPSSYVDPDDEADTIVGPL